MPASSQIVLKPTFPLDEAEINRRSLWRKVEHPVSWGIPLVCLAAGIALQSGLWPVVLLLTGGIFGVNWFWKHRSREVMAEVIEGMIAESNRTQDQKLSGIIRSYRARGLHHYATALGKFLLLKQHIEKRLHAGRASEGITPTVEQVEKLVDNVCGAVCREFHKAASLDGELGDVLTSRDRSRLEALQKSRDEVLEAIMHAYETLYEALAAILDLESAREATAPDLEASTRQHLDVPDLKDVLEKLQEENRLARRVRERLEIPAASRGEPDFGIFSQELDPVGETTSTDRVSE